MPSHVALSIHPRDPLILRDARPFSDNPGARAVTLPWPWPSTVAGMLRTHIGIMAGVDWNGTGPDLVRQIGLRGPLLLAKRTAAASWSVYFPFPADAVLLRDNTGDAEAIKNPAKAVRLRPVETNDLTNGAGSDLPMPGLRSLTITSEEKPFEQARFWSLDDILTWLKSPTSTAVPGNWLPALPTATRTHVGIDPKTQAAAEGLLFTTVGLAFPPLENRSGCPPIEAAMVCQVTLPDSSDIPEALQNWKPTEMFLPLGGERRAVEIAPFRAWTSAMEASMDWLQALVGNPRLRLLMVTPGIFGRGWLPGWIDPATLEGTPPHCAGLKLRLVSAAVPRRVAISGWAMGKGAGGTPKPTRYAVPAGSIYFFEVQGGQLTIDYLRTLWLGSICDGEQDRRDGFGLVLPGVW